MNCSDEWQALNLRSNFAQTFQLQIQEIIDKVCSELVPEDQLVRIDSLQIEMGKFSQHSFRTDFEIVFAYKFEQALREQLAKNSPEEKRIAIQFANEEIFEFFLETGNLPWWIGEKDIDLTMFSLAVFEGNMIFRFFDTQREDVVIWRRAAWQMPQATKIALIQFFPELLTALDLLKQWINDISGLQTSEISFSGEMIEELVLMCAPAIFKTSDVSSVLWLPFADAIRRQVRDENVADAVIQNLVSALALKENIPETVSAGQHALIVEMPAEKVFDAANEKYFVSHAGIILLTPFFKQLFDQLELFKDGEWTSFEAHMKAVHILGFLSTGQQRLPEYSLTLEKVICGMPEAMPIQRDIDLTETDVANCNELLQAVISHWSVLKNTSIDGLRGNFLVRDGLLTSHETGWQLQVERKTIDVLLAQIPWGFTTAAFPWRRDLILTEW
ncbi:hypothetical protein DN068_08310 [Taibaiella soli]|uniref:Uncharacterized protein n=2 Tax=Taibaiella soli TaxID=1649169 RepID=A0A2W2AZD5_9BACT|nr:hypothetical protein DN068_08310 [Taibaiella soli]